jgi:penicillin-binding protein 1A
LARPLLQAHGMEARAFLRTLGDRWRHLSRQTALAILLTVLVALFAFFVLAWDHCFFSTCPDVGTLAAYQPGGAPLLLDRNGEVFADLTPVEHTTVPLGKLPSLVPQAFLAVEDKRFQEHGGIDWRRVGGAVMADLRAGGFEQGSSTITMQLARNLFPERLPGQRQTLARKLLEVKVAREIERRFSKQEILELYLNHIYFGNRAHGIEAASRQYFGIPATQLTLAQAALLAAQPKAPSHYDPRRHPDAALERRNLVLTLMQEQGRIPRREAEAAKTEPLGLAQPPRQARVEAGLAPWFVDQVRRELEEHFGGSLYTKPLRIRTTLDSRAQRAAEEELSRQLKLIESGQLGAFDGPRYASADAPAAEKPEPRQSGPAYLQGAVVSIDPADGDVLAWVGGRDFSQSQFDRVAMARRQAGSAFKPFVYAAALRDGWVLSQPLEDSPLSVRLSGGKVWQPKNFNDRYGSRVTLREALVRSMNVPTVRLAEAVGLGDVAAAAHQSGIGQPLPELPSIALGTVAVSPLELTTAYTPFAGLGTGTEPRLILSVEDEDGRVLWKPEPRRRKAVDPRVAYLITDVLTEALERGTGMAALGGGLGGMKVPAAGKTGTTNDGADTWFIGYTPDLVTGIWMGFDQPRPILEDATGGRLPAPVWGRMMQRFYTGRKPPAPWHRPDGVVARSVDPATGLLLKEGCSPVSGTPYEELFLAGAQPAAWCPGREGVPENGFPATRRTAEQRAAQTLAEQSEKAEKAEQAAQKKEEEAARKKEEQAEKERIAREKRDARERADREARLAQKEKEIAAREAALRRAEEDQKRTAQTAKREHDKAEAAKVARAQAEKDKRDRAEAAKLAKAKAKVEWQERQAQAERAAQAKADKAERARAGRSRAADPESRDGEIAAQQPEPERRLERRSERQVEPMPEPEQSAPDVQEPSSDDLSGWWELTNRIDETNYDAYRGLRLGYRLHLEQAGDRITGRGQKWTEDGHGLSAGARTPITVRGTVHGESVVLEFTEQGAHRATGGVFQWRLTPDGATLRGSFTSSAAAARGPSIARRLE